MSKAVMFHEYGSPDVLRVADIDPPQPGPRDVRIQVRAAGVQPFDNLFRSGEAAAWIPATFPQQTGNEAAGVIDDVGADVTEFSPGDEVLGPVNLAAFAELAVLDADQIAAKPADMPWEQAGALSASGQTAHTALDELKVEAGDVVLIHAAAGGVGSMAVQIALARGAIVIGTASVPNHEYLRLLGAIPVTYGDGLADRVLGIAAIDAALDCVGTEESLRVSRELISGGHRAGTVTFNPLASELGIRRITTQRSAARLRALVDLYTDGKLRVHVVQTFPLDRAADAHREVAAGHVRGKVVIVNRDYGDSRTSGG